MKRWLLTVACVLALLLMAPAASAQVPEKIEMQYPQRYLSAQEEYSVRLEDYVDPLEFRAYLSAQLVSCPDSVDISQFQIPDSDEMIRQVMEFVWYQLPESFHVWGASATGYGSDYVTTVYLSYKEGMDTAEQYAYYRNRFLQAANYLLEGVENNNGLTDVEKTLILHDRLANWAAYNYRDYLDNTLTDDDYTAYGIFAKQTGVCQGYAMAYMYLLGRVDIYSGYVSSEALNHGWNIVYIDGVPYHVDVTWDDPVWDQTGIVLHSNFLRSTDGIIATGHDGGDFNTTPTDTTYDSYYWQNVDTAFQLIGEDIYFIDDVKHTIDKADGTRFTTVCAVDEHWYISEHASYSALSCLGSTEDQLLYSGAKAIYSVDPATGTKTVIFEPDLSAEPYLGIYGFKYEKNYLICEVDTDYNYDEETEDKFIRQYYVPTAGEYRVAFLNWDGSVVSAMYYPYGATVQIPPAPTRPNDEQYTYTFAGWDKQIVRVTEDVAYTAVYSAKLKEGWYTEDGNRYYYEDGEKVTNDWRWDGNYCCYLTGDGTPAREQWIQYDNGWYYVDANGYRLEDCWLRLDGKTYYLDGAGRRVTGGFLINGEMYYFGNDGALLNRYTVTFRDWDGTILRSEEYSEGDTVWAPPNPYRAADNTYTYTFIGWDKPLATVTGNTVYTATYAKEYINSRIIFQNDDGTLLDSFYYHYGDAVSRPSDPYKAPDGVYKYTFFGWDPEIKAVTGDAVYTAVYSKIAMKNGWYTVDQKWYYYENDRMVTNAWRENESDRYQGEDSLCWLGADGAMVTNTWFTLDGKTYYCDGSGYRAKGLKYIEEKWYMFDDDGVLLPSYTVTFLDWDGTVLWQLECYHGESFNLPKDPSRASDGEYNYTFAGWDKEVETSCYANATYTATYTRTEIVKPVKNGWIREGGKWCYYENDLKVKNAWRQDSAGWCWLDANGHMVYSQWVEAGGNKYYVNGSGYRVTGEQTIDGKSCYFDENGVYKVRYTVTFQNADGTVLSTKLYFAGDTVTVPANPAKAADANYTYTFAGWDKTVTKVTGDATYTATYTKTAKPTVDTSKNGWYKENGDWRHPRRRTRDRPLLYRDWDALSGMPPFPR